MKQWIYVRVQEKNEKKKSKKDKKLYF